MDDPSLKLFFKGGNAPLDPLAMELGMPELLAVIAPMPKSHGHHTRVSSSRHGCHTRVHPIVSRMFSALQCPDGLSFSTSGGPGVSTTIRCAFYDGSYHRVWAASAPAPPEATSAPAPPEAAQRNLLQLLPRQRRGPLQLPLRLHPLQLLPRQWRLQLLTKQQNLLMNSLSVLYLLRKPSLNPLCFLL